MSGNLELRTESCDGPARANSVIATTPRDLVTTNVAAELERHAAEAERCMARARRALCRLDAVTGGGSSVALELARRTATAAVAADAALERLGDVTRGAFDLDEKVDLLLAARAVLDALKESSELLDVFAEAATQARCGGATWREVLASSGSRLAG